jgi:hypothetical protein
MNAEKYGTNLWTAIGACLSAKSILILNSYFIRVVVLKDYSPIPVLRNLAPELTKDYWNGILYSGTVIPLLDFMSLTLCVICLAQIVSIFMFSKKVSINIASKSLFIRCCAVFLLLCGPTYI